MALTLEKLQRLERVGLVKYFDDNEAAWTAAAKDAFDYIKKGFAGEKVRPDDVNGTVAVGSGDRSGAKIVLE